MSTKAEQLADALAARAKILVGQRYRMADGREVERANLDEVNKLIEKLEIKAGREARGGGISIRLGVPRR